jgi:hypothetical protein
MSNCLNRNSVGIVFGLSSDFNEFVRPKFEVSGATKINCDISGITTGDTGVYSVSDETEIPLEFIFNDDNSSFFNENKSKFKYSIHRYNPDINGFNRVPIYNSEEFGWSEISGTTTINTTIPINELNVDGEYIIKGNFTNTFSTEFMSHLNTTYDTSLFISGDEYGYYQDDRDYYFIVVYKPEKPSLGVGTNAPITINTLRSVSYDLVNNQTQIQVPESQNGYIVALNGLVLAEYFDYTISTLTNESVTTNIIELVSPGVLGDILTISYISTGGNNTLITKTISVDTKIPSGPQGSQGISDYYLNLTTDKYEIYVDSDPLTQNDIIVTINGAVIANNIDYYQSSSNPKRIILEGDIVEGDIINVYYNSFTNLVDDILTDTPTFAWSVETPFLVSNGSFTLEISSDINFSVIINSDTIPYIVGQNSYFLPVNLNASYNDALYYRVRNDKNYETLCGQTLTSTTYSDVTKIKLKTNSINRY